MTSGSHHSAKAYGRGKGRGRLRVANALLLGTLLLVSGTSHAQAPTTRRTAIAPAPGDLADRAHLFSANEGTDALASAIQTSGQLSRGAIQVSTVASGLLDGVRVGVGYTFRTVATLSAGDWAAKGAQQSFSNAARVIDDAVSDTKAVETNPSQLAQSTAALEGDLPALADAVAIKACARGLEILDRWMRIGGDSGTAALAPRVTVSAPASIDIPLRLVRDAQESDLPAAPSMSRPLMVRLSNVGDWSALAGRSDLRSNEAPTRGAELTVLLDYRPAPDPVPGAAPDLGQMPWRSREPIGFVRTGRFEIGVFAREQLDAAFSSGVLTYATLNVMSARGFAFGQALQNAARFHAQARIARLEVGRRYGLDADGLGVTPYLAFQAERVRMPYDTGAAAAIPLQLGAFYRPAYDSDVMHEIGLQIDRSVTGADTFTFFGRLAWLHDYQDGLSKRARFDAIPGSTFVFDGPGFAHDAARVSLGIDAQFASGLWLMIQTESDLSPSSRAVGAGAALAFRW